MIVPSSQTVRYGQRSLRIVAPQIRNTEHAAISSQEH